MTDRHQAPSYPLRMPPELKERVADAAKTSGRSLHAEIVARLQQSFEGGGVKDAADKLIVAGFVLRMIQNTVPDAEVRADIATMAKYIGSNSVDDQSVAALEAVSRLQKKHLAKTFAGLTR